MIGLFTSFIWGQHHDNNWILSDDNGAVRVSFSTGSPELQPITTDLQFEGASAVISNAEGELQFYTNGCQVYNYRHERMEGGYGINFGDIFLRFCVDQGSGTGRGYPNSPGSTLIVPIPHSKDKYFMLHQPREQSDTLINGGNAFTSRLYLTTIEMSENEGDGAVVSKNVTTNEFYYEGGGQALNKHANGIDWWLVSPLWKTVSLSI